MFSLQTIFGQGKQFYTLLEATPRSPPTTAPWPCTRCSRTPSAPRRWTPSSWPASASARPPTRSARSWSTASSPPIEREDIEALGSALYKIPKQVEKFADRYSLARHRLDDIDFAPRAAMLEQAAAVVVKMVARAAQHEAGADEGSSTTACARSRPKPTA